MFWPRLCQALGEGWAAAGHPWATPRGRQRQQDAVHQAVEGSLRRRSRSEALAALGASGCICGAIATVPDVAQDAQLRANGAYATIHHQVAGRFETVAAPFAVGGATVKPRGPAPEPGEHTKVVLQSQLGLTEPEVHGLFEAGVVGPKLIEGTPIARWAATVAAKL